MAEPVSRPEGEGALLDVILAIFREELQIDAIGPDTDLIVGGLLDSLALVDLLFALERRCGLEVRMEAIEFEDFETPATIARWLRGELGP